MSKFLLQKLELNEQSLMDSQMAYKIPHFNTGDIVSVKTTVSYTSKKRQVFTGVCISITKKGLRSSFVLRNMVDGNGIECFFPLYSPMIHQIQVLKRKKTRASKLYYLRKKEHYTTI